MHACVNAPAAVVRLVMRMSNHYFLPDVIVLLVYFAFIIIRPVEFLVT
jgi:hypothetical protein